MSLPLNAFVVCLSIPPGSFGPIVYVAPPCTKDFLCGLGTKCDLESLSFMISTPDVLVTFYYCDKTP